MQHSMTLWGERLAIPTVRNLVAALLVDGRPDAVNLADRLGSCLDREVVMMSLDVAERDTLLSVLEDPPDDLAELRGELLRDYEQRSREG